MKFSLMRIIRIVARRGEFYFNFNISIETVRIFSFEVRNHKFQHKFETLPSNTRPRHSRRNWDVTVTRFHHHKVPRYVYSNFTNRIDISGSLSRGFLFSFFFFFEEEGRGALITRSKVFISIPVQVALNCALNEITFFPRKSGIGTREVDGKKRLDYG